jgi:teichuronic acid biosynthesis glycosyltransferase TuaG
MIYNTPLVSIIVPTNRRITYLNKCIESILEQTYPHFEVLIISDGDDEKTEQLVSKYWADKRVRFFENRKTGLPAVLRNFGLTQAKGDYIAFCDDDDMWLQNKLEKQMALFTQLNIEVCFTLSEKIDGHGNEIEIPRYKKLRFFLDRLFHTFDFYLLFSNYVTLSSLIVKKDIIQIFNEDMHLRGSEDYDFSLRLCKNAKPFFLQEKLVQYRIHNENLSGDTQMAYNRAIKILEQKLITREYGYMITKIAKISYTMRLYLNLIFR